MQRDSLLRVAPSEAAASIDCARCDAVCCRLPVLVQADDAVPSHFVERDRHGMRFMAQDEEGWCVALDASRMNCSIYATRPQTCRDFREGGAACRDVRADYRRIGLRLIPPTPYPRSDL